MLAYIGDDSPDANNVETWIGDLLGDLRHFADFVGIEFNPDAGKRVYLDEKKEDEAGEFVPRNEWYT